MLVPVDMARWALPHRLESVELALYHRACRGLVKAAQHGPAHGPGKRHPVAGGAGKLAGPIKVQTHIDAPAHLRQQRGIDRPARRQHHRAGSADAAQRGEPCNAFGNGLAGRKVVGADRQAFHYPRQNSG